MIPVQSADTFWGRVVVRRDLLELFLLLLTAGCGAGWRRIDPAPAPSIGVAFLGMAALGALLCLKYGAD